MVLCRESTRFLLSVFLFLGYAVGAFLALYIFSAHFSA